MWVAWSYRNKVIFEHVIMVVYGYIRLVQEYGNYAKKKVFLPTTRCQIRAPTRGPALLQDMLKLTQMHIFIKMWHAI